MMWWKLLIAGIVGGVLGGMGMGGGTLLIPILTLILNVPQLNAQAINLISFIPMAVVTLFIHIKNGLVDFKQLLWLTPPAALACAASAYFASSLSANTLRKCFGAFMIVIGVVFLIKMGKEFISSMMSDHK